MMISQNFLRDLQSRFGVLLGAKSEMQRLFRMLRKRPFEQEFEILKLLDPKGRCAIDVGANRGQSIDAIRLYHPSTQINSFEPNVRLFEKLISRFGEDENLKLQNTGLGNEELTARLYVPYYRNFLYDGLSSFSKSHASNWLNEDTVWRFDPNLLRVEQHTCHIGVLDTFSFEPFFLKIHVQGFELDVLEGAKETIRSCCPVLLMANNKDADIWLRHEGWSQYVFKNGKWVQLLNNDLSIYNSVYLNEHKEEHIKLIKSFQ